MEQRRNDKVKRILFLLIMLELFAVVIFAQDPRTRPLPKRLSPASASGQFIIADGSLDGQWNSAVIWDGTYLLLNGDTVAVLPLGAIVEIDGDTTNELQILSISGDTLTISDGNSVILPAGGGGTDDQTLSLVGTDLSIESGNTVSLAALQDGTGTDDQTLSISNDTLTIESGNFVVLPGGGTDDQTLSLVTNTLSIESGNSVDLSPYLDNTDAQTLSLGGTVLSITGGNSVDLAPLQDGTGTDDQVLSISNDTLYIEDGNNVVLTPYLDNTDAQALSLVGTDLSITGGNTVDLVSLQDGYLGADIAANTATYDAGGTADFKIIDPDSIYFDIDGAGGVMDYFLMSESGLYWGVGNTASFRSYFSASSTGTTVWTIIGSDMQINMLSSASDFSLTVGGDINFGNSSTDAINIYGRYALANDSPSIISGDTSVMIWRGTGATTISEMILLDDLISSAGTDDQVLSISNDTLSIESGNFVVLPSGAADNWGTQSVISSSWFSGTGIVGDTLDLAQNGATAGQTIKWFDGFGWLPGIDNNTNLTNEQVQDYFAQLLVGNTETGITVTYDDAGDLLNFEVTGGGATGGGIYGGDGNLGAVGFQDYLSVGIDSSQVLSFEIDASPTFWGGGLRIYTDYNNDDAISTAFKIATPSDSLWFEHFNQGTKMVYQTPTSQYTDFSIEVKPSTLAASGGLDLNGGLNVDSVGLVNFWNRTTTQRDLLPASIIDEGDLFYNTTLSAFQYWDGSAWVTFPGGGTGGIYSGDGSLIEVTSVTVPANDYLEFLVTPGPTNHGKAIHIDLGSQTDDMTSIPFSITSNSNDSLYFEFKDVQTPTIAYQAGGGNAFGLAIDALGGPSAVATRGSGWLELNGSRVDTLGLFKPLSATTATRNTWGVSNVWQPTSGYMFYNTDSLKYQYYDGSSWQTFPGSGGGTSGVQSVSGSGAISVGGTAADPVVSWNAGNIVINEAIDFDDYILWYGALSRRATVDTLLGFDVFQLNGVDLEVSQRLDGDATYSLSLMPLGVVPPASDVSNTTTFTATAGEINLVDVTSGTVSVTPPAGPAAGDRFAVVDSRNNAGTNNITVNFSGSTQKLWGTVQNYVLSTNGEYAEFVYMGANTGWILTK